MHSMAFLGVFHQVAPGRGCEQSAVFDALANQLGALGVDLTAAEGIVANLRVAHILIGGQTDSRAVGLQIGVGTICQQIVQRGGLGDHNSITAAAVTLADTVHNYQYNGFFHIGFLHNYHNM